MKTDTPKPSPDLDENFDNGGQVTCSDKTGTTNSIDWLNGYHQALEDAADFIEQNVQTMTDPRIFMPRLDGNQYGLEYAKAILAMKDNGL